MGSKAVATILMGNSATHTITVPSNKIKPMHELKTMLKEAKNFLFSDDGEVIIVNQIHIVKLEEK